MRRFRVSLALVFVRPWDEILIMTFSPPLPPPPKKKKAGWTPTLDAKRVTRRVPSQT